MVWQKRKDEQPLFADKECQHKSLRYPGSANYEEEEIREEQRERYRENNEEPDGFRRFRNRADIFARSPFSTLKFRHGLMPAGYALPSLHSSLWVTCPATNSIPDISCNCRRISSIPDVPS